MKDKNLVKDLHAYFKLCQMPKLHERYQLFYFNIKFTLTTWGFFFSGQCSVYGVSYWKLVISGSSVYSHSDCTSVFSKLQPLESHRHIFFFFCHIPVLNALRFTCFLNCLTFLNNMEVNTENVHFYLTWKTVDHSNS